METAFVRFDSFMKLCRDDPKKAANLLAGTAIASDERAYVVAKYAKDYQRILLDTKHEFQQRMLLLEQRAEAEFMDGATPLIKDVEEIGPSSLLNISGNSAPITVNFLGNALGSKSGTSVDNLQLRSEAVSYAPNELEVLRLIDKYS
jgi:hypothetical protein